MVRLIVPTIHSRVQTERGQVYTIHKNMNTISNRRLPLSSRPLSHHVDTGTACHELTLEIPFSLVQQSPSSDKEVMEPTIKQENSGDTKLRVERELTDRNPLVLSILLKLGQW